MAGLLNKLGLRSNQRRRNSFCAHLNSIGVEANLAQKGQPEELFRESQEYSTGLIYIHDRNLEWANVVQGNYRTRLTRDFLFFRSLGQPFYYRIWYGLYDPNLKIAAPTLKFQSKRHRSMGSLGRAVDVTWHNRLETVELEPLTSDQTIKDHLMEAGVDMEAIAFPDGYWIIANREAGKPPSRRIWECYQAVAEGLKRSSKGYDPKRLL